jgi:hypothetical protein
MAMSDFVRYEKLSKKKRREVDALARSDFGLLRPETKRLESKKLYNRKKARRLGGFPDAGLSFMTFLGLAEWLGTLNASSPSFYLSLV